MANFSQYGTTSLTQNTKSTRHHAHTANKNNLGSEVMPNSKHLNPFGFPANVLEGPLQTLQNIFHKWKEIIKLVIYLGRSLLHTRNVALILDGVTGYFSP